MSDARETSSPSLCIRFRTRAYIRTTRNCSEGILEWLRERN